MRMLEIKALNFDFKYPTPFLVHVCIILIKQSNSYRKQFSKTNQTSPLNQHLISKSTIAL